MKQLSMMDFDAFCERKSDYKGIQDLSTVELMDYLLNGNIKILEKSKIKEPIPTKQSKIILKVGFYVRLLNDDVYYITDTGIPRVREGQRKSFKTRDRCNKTITERNMLKTIMCDIYVDGEKRCLYFDETECLEAHKEMIDCIYQHDVIDTKQGNRMLVLNRIETKRDKFLLCEKFDKRYIIRNDDIIKKINSTKVDVRFLNVGDKVKHKYLGWFVISELWHHKVSVYKKDGGTFWIKEQDIIDSEEKEA